MITRKFQPGMVYVAGCTELAKLNSLPGFGAPREFQQCSVLDTETGEVKGLSSLRREPATLAAGGSGTRGGAAQAPN